MGQKRGLQRRDKNNGLRWPRWGCYDGCAEWHAKTRSGMNTSEEQQEWRRIPKRSPREDWTGTGMWWGEMANTYWGKCWGRIYQGKGREDDRKQDGKTRVNEIWKLLDWERARRRTGRCGERSSVIPATIHDGKSQRKGRRKSNEPWLSFFASVFLENNGVGFTNRVFYLANDCFRLNHSQSRQWSHPACRYIIVGGQKLTKQCLTDFIISSEVVRSDRIALTSVALKEANIAHWDQQFLCSLKLALCLPRWQLLFTKANPLSAGASGYSASSAVWSNRCHRLNRKVWQSGRKLPPRDVLLSAVRGARQPVHD